jgi:hypothetical protein
MEQDLHRTAWNRLAVLLQVPRTTGVFLLGVGAGRSPQEVLMVGSARNLRARLLEILRAGDVRAAGATVVHWVSDLSEEQARLAERMFVRRFDPPFNPAPRTRYFDILAG